MAEPGRAAATAVAAEQYIGECVAKCAQCVLASRILSEPALRTAAPDRRRSRWVSRCSLFLAGFWLVHSQPFGLHQPVAVLA